MQSIHCAQAFTHRTSAKHEGARSQAQRTSSSCGLWSGSGRPSELSSPHELYISCGLKIQYQVPAGVVQIH